MGGARTIQLHFFWIGLILPPITYYIFKYTKSDFVRKINWPLIFVGTYNVPPAVRSFSYNSGLRYILR